MLKVEIDLPQGIRVAEDRAQFLSLQSHRLAAASEASQMSDRDNSAIDSDAAAPTQAAAVDLEEARHRLLSESFEAVLVAGSGDGSEEEQSAPGTVTNRLEAILPEAVDPAYWVAIGIQRDSLILLASRVNNECCSVRLAKMN